MSATPAPSVRISLGDDPGELTRLAAEAEQFLDTLTLPPPVGFKVQLVLEELVTNILRHGFSGGQGHTIQIELTFSGAGVELSVEDDGQPFDPMQAPPPDLDSPLEERAVGGLGIHLLRQVASDLTYARVDGRNRMRLQVPVDTPDAPDAD